MSQINEKGSRARQGALKALRWILSTEQPLSCEAVVQAVNETTGTILAIPDIISMRNNSIVLDKESNIFRSTYLSVREYLEFREDFSPSAVHQVVALQCLRSCHTILRENGSYCEDFDGSQYQHYTLLYWPVHYYCTPNDLPLPLLDVLSSLLKDHRSNTSRYATWLQIVSSLKTKCIAEKWRLWYKLASSRPPDPIFLVINFDLKPILKRLPRDS